MDEDWAHLGVVQSDVLDLDVGRPGAPAHGTWLGGGVGVPFPSYALGASVQWRVLGGWVFFLITPTFAMFSP